MNFRPLPLYTWRGEQPRGAGVRLHLFVDRCAECNGILWRRPKNREGYGLPRHHACLERLIAAKWPELACFVCGRTVA